MDWRKSSFSGDAGNCVEVRGDLSALRDSKHPHTEIAIDRKALASMVQVLANR